MLPRLIGEDIELSIVPQNSATKVKLDPVQIEQVVMNLAGNARDAMPQGGKLTIITRDVDLDGDYVTTHPVVPAGRYVALRSATLVKGSMGSIFPTSSSPSTRPRKTVKEPGSDSRPSMAS